MGSAPFRLLPSEVMVKIVTWLVRRATGEAVMIVPVCPKSVKHTPKEE